VRADVTICNVFAPLARKISRHLAAVEIASQSTCHAEVVHEERMLVDMLEDAEFSFGQRQLKPTLEVEVSVKSRLLVLLPGRYSLHG